MRDLKLHRDESGLVSIIVTMIIMIVLSITVIGFAQISRREQRQTLDRQLSTGAYYAAESGINDAIKLIQAGTLTSDITDCNDGTFSATRSLGGPTSYSCLLVSQSPTSLEYGAVSTDKSQIVNLNSSSSPIKKVTVSWQDKNGTASNFNTGYPNFPKASDWTWDMGVVEVSLTPVGAPTDFSRSNLINNTLVAYLYPSDNNDGTNDITLASGPSAQGTIKEVKCNGGGTPKKCTANLTLPTASSKFIMRVKAIYKTAATTISAQDASNNQLKLVGAQAVIDSTGKANDVLRRVQVRVPLGKEYNYPEYVLDSADSICKRLKVYPGGGSVDDPSTPADPACAIN